MSWIPTLDDLFWEYMYAHNRDALTQEEYEIEWSKWFWSYFVDENPTMMGTAIPCHPNANASRPLPSLDLQHSQLSNLGHSYPSTSQGDFNKPHQCSFCAKVYPRVASAKGCENRHRHIKPYTCTKKCGDESWYEAYDLAL
jgi:hypothetical protein